MRTLVILNPAAGYGRGRAWRERIVRGLRAQGWQTDLVETSSPGEATALAREAAREGWPRVVAAGGDGTAHEVANGLLAVPPDRDGATPTALGVIPIGTGNDFARLLRLRPDVPERTTLRLAGGQPGCFDVGRVAGEYFINAAGAGFTAEVVRRVNAVGHLRGQLRYLTAACATFARFRPPTFEVTAPELVERGPMMLAEVAVGRTGGGGFRFAPTADPADGMLDVCIVRRVGPMGFLAKLPRVMRGTHGTLKEVALFKTRWVRIRSVDGPLHLHLDGEFRAPDEQEITVSIEPGRLRVLIAA